ncbi:MAG: hypothetical protein IKC01_03780 [Clostridia bacterium]|nr:hypothetical protein [Clostridia bacterium]MBR3605475.1 hypothetical protein [Candidatus Gastranaerophilales bacterium]
MTVNDKIEMIKKIEFGDIDGYGDPNLEQYFLDSDYFEKVVNKKTFYIIGKKGTGKSAIYRMIKGQSFEKGVIVENKDFGDYPFEKLLTLSDDNYPKPNQYQTVWENLIFNIFSKLISDYPVLDDDKNSYFKMIDDYAKTCIGNLVDMHKDIITRTQKTNVGLSYKGIQGSNEIEKSLSIGSGVNNITQINSVLQQTILEYFKTCNENRKIIIQFDRLDDNYNQYQNIEEYYQCIISLFKVVYKINQSFRAVNIKNAKVVLYLRSDIFRELGKRDAESARWTDFSVFLNWAIVNRIDWENPLLLQMINKRIFNSLKLPEISFNELFDTEAINLKNHSGRQIDVFHYIIEKTMHRPRDFIQFCKYIQEECISTNTLYFRTIKNAEKRFSDWLVNSEIVNEINPIIKDTDSLFEMLKLLGRKPFSLNELSKQIHFLKSNDFDAISLATYLYDIGILLNVDMKQGTIRFRSSFRNDGKFDRNQKIMIHPGVWIGINS